jgi:hypothetical protein
LICANACLGLVIPTAMVMALDEHGDNAGLASSLGGMLQMLAGGVLTMLAGPFFDGTPLPMVAAIAIAAVLSFAAMRFTAAARTPAVGGLAVLIAETEKPRCGYRTAAGVFINAWRQTGNF